MFYVLFLLVVLLDQAVKLWVRLHMIVGQSIPVREGFQLTYYQNTGAMGSSFEGYGRYFIVPAIFAVFIAVYLLRKGRLNGVMLKCGAALFTGGAAGNAIDRLLFGRVTDFLDFGRGISNLADHAISVGLLFILLHELIIDPLMKKKNKKLCY
ncbi:signal peptidase II [Gorillibacterium massiliense]|uniref:signal peptidase II n=1 Tax=Gorillibacterium massiliense TaxID=1280390 RepID=UPI000592D4F6|nr:signal peptidase II [Gorillibacterium massiliense]